MDGRVFCMIFGVVLFIVITYLIFGGGDDDDDAAPKAAILVKPNICKQTETRFHKQYLVENHLNQLRLNDNYTDIELIAQNMVVRAHKIILAAQSQYFDTKINESNINTSTTNNGSITQQFSIEFIEHKTLITVLNFMYTATLSDDIFQNRDDFENVLRAATKFELDSLKCEISKRLNARINIHNAGSIVALAAETNTGFLMIVAANFLLDQYPQVSQTTEWHAVIKEHKDILANAIDFHANLPENSTCDIQCIPSTLGSDAVFTRLRKFFLDQRFADAEIDLTPKIGSGRSTVFHVNRATLIGQSAAFRHAFGNSQRIELHGIEIDVMEEFLVYMYSGWPTEKMKKMPAGLLYLSSTYGMNGLQTACEDILIDDLKIENAAEIIVVADHANSKRLFSIALDFILKNRRFIVKTNAWIDLRRNHPEILTKIT